MLTARCRPWCSLLGLLMSLPSGLDGRDEGELRGYRECGTKEMIDIGNEASLQDRLSVWGG